MTTCPRCGLSLRAPVAACPRCGLPFAPPAQPPQSAQNGYEDYGNGYNGYSGYDSATPAWMQQARPQQPQAPQQRPAPQPPQPPQPPQQHPYGQPGMQPGTQPGARPGFSMNELVSEEALPDWLKQASADSAQPTQRQPATGMPSSGPYGAPQPYPPASPPASSPARSPAYPVAYPPANAPAYPQANQWGAPGYGGGYAPMPTEEPPVGRPDASAFPGIESAGSYQSPLADGGGLSAGSLLDPNALPSWLSGQQGQAAAGNMRSGEGMRAQSLIDDAALPEWMRNEPNGNGNGNGNGSAGVLAQAQAALPPAAPTWGGYPAASPVSPVSPVAPLASPALPGASVYPPGGYGSMQPQLQPQPPAFAVTNGQMNGQQGISARDLVDPNAMPSWAQPQGGAPSAGVGMQAGQAGQAGQTGQGQWSASDLIDPAMLPGWVRENDAAAPQGAIAQPNLPGQPGQPAPLSPMSPLSPIPPDPAYDAPRERTGRVPAPQSARGPGASAQHRVPDYEPPEQDFGASRASARGPASRKYPAARPLDDDEKPAWLRDGAASGSNAFDGRDAYDGYDGYSQGQGQPDRPAYPAGRPGARQDGRPDGRPERGPRSWNGYDDQNGQNGQNGQTSHTARRRQAPRAQRPMDQSWAEPDGYDNSPFGRSPAPPRGAQRRQRDQRDAKPAEKQRKGGFFGFLRRG